MRSAVRSLSGADSRVLRVSVWKYTQPLSHPLYDTADHGPYLNAVVDVEGSYDPVSFYHHVLMPIEDSLGHCRQHKWRPRCIDIDVVFAAQNNATFFSDCTPIFVSQDGFFVPHVAYPERPFWEELIASMQDVADVSKR